LELHMPRLRNMVPKYRLHKASGQAIVSFDGIDHYLGPHNTDVSRREYDRLISEYLGSGRNSAAMNRSFGIAISALLESFHSFAEDFYVKNGVPTSELLAYERVIGSLASYLEHRVGDFGPLALRAVRDGWVKQGLSRSTCNKNQRRVVRIWKWGVSRELVAPEAWQALTSVEGLRKGKTIAPESKPVPPVDVERIQETIPHLSPIVADMVRLQLLTSMRPGEVCGLRPCDVDRSSDVWEYRPSSHKTEHHGRSRTIYLGPQAAAILAPYLFREPTAHCFSADASREWFREQRAAARKTAPSCGNARGRKHDQNPRPRRSRFPRDHFDTSSYGHAIALACRKAWPAPESIAKDKAKAMAWNTANRWAPNQIRHTGATEIRKKFGIEAAQVILGHASAQVTQIYAERDAEKARDVIRQIG
jgi:integrase